MAWSQWKSLRTEVMGAAAAIVVPGFGTVSADSGTK